MSLCGLAKGAGVGTPGAQESSLRLKGGGAGAEGNMNPRQAPAGKQNESNQERRSLTSKRKPLVGMSTEATWMLVKGKTERIINFH